MSANEVMQQLATNPKVGAAIGTAMIGGGTALDWIPNDIGKLAALVGIGLSLVLIYTHFRKGRIEYKKTQLEILILREKEAERIEAALRRKEEGG